MLLEISRAFDCTGLTNPVLYITHTLCVTCPEHTQICPYARPHGSHIYPMCNENRLPVHSDMVHKKDNLRTHPRRDSCNQTLHIFQCHRKFCTQDKKLSHRGIVYMRSDRQTVHPYGTCRTYHAHQSVASRPTTRQGVRSCTRTNPRSTVRRVSPFLSSAYMCDTRHTPHVRWKM